MIYIDELQSMKMYNRNFFLPINEKNKKKGSAVFLITPNIESSIDLMNKKYIINNNYFDSYYLEKDITFFINQEGALLERFVEENGKYSAPMSISDIKKNHPDISNKLLKDPVHKWRAETGIELIHNEPSREELNRIWNNWNCMSVKQKSISDKKSMELFKMNNKDHYYSIINSNDILESSNIINDNIIYAPGEYLLEQYQFNDDYLKAKTEAGNIITFFPEATTSNTYLKRLLYEERIRNAKSIMNIYKDIKERTPKIKRTFVDLKFYKEYNLFIDLSYYNSVFLRNNIYKLDRGVDIYFDFLNRFIDDKRVDDAGYIKKTVFIPVEGWNIQEESFIWDSRKNINPISIIYRLMKSNMQKLKNAWKDYNFLFLGDNGYFKVDFDKFELKDLSRFTQFITKIEKNDVDIDQDSNPNLESPKAILSNIVDKIEKSQNITINNLTGQPSIITKDELDTKIDNADIKSSDAEKEKEELVTKLKAVASTANNTDDAMEALDALDNNDIKKLLLDLAAQEDNQVKLNAARSSRIAKVNDNFLNSKIKNVSIRDMIDNKSLEQELPKTELKIDSINDEWKNMQFLNFEKVYNMDQDIIKILYSFSEKSMPIAIRNIEVLDTTTSEDYMETYTVQCEDANGQRFTLTFDVPKFKNDRFMRLRGNEKVTNGQLFLLPVIKTDEDTVQIVSNYNKIFVKRYGTTSGKSYITADKIIKTISKLGNNKNIKIITGDNNKICSKYELPIDYIDLSTEFTSIETPDHIIYFNQDEIRDKYKIDESKGVPIALDKSNNTIVYYTDNLVTCSDLIYSMLYTTKLKDFQDIYDKIKPASRYTYSKASILNTDIPIIVIMAYNVGLQEAMKRGNIKFDLIESRSNLNKSESFDSIKFEDGYIQYELNYNSSLLMNGLKECDTQSHSLTEINDKTMWVEFLDNFGGRIKADGLDNFYDLMIDPITKEVCDRYNLPNDYIGILAYSNLLLADNKYNQHSDLTGNRYRSNEIIAGYVYKSLADSYGEYKNQLKRNRKGAVMTMKQSSVIDSVLMDPTASDLSILNPLLEIESANTVSFKGLSGMNSDRAYGLDKRTYDKSMINLLALSTGFAANVGINRQTTIDMNIEGARGYIKTTDDLDNMSVTKTLSITEALTPFGTTHDDPFRSAMTFIQTSKHGMRVKNAMPMLVTNGADEALAYMTSDTFAFKAKDDGTIIEKTDEYMIVSYKNGTNEFVDLRELVKKNSDGGFYITIKLDTEYKQGNKFKANDILAYDKLSYSNNVSPSNNIAYNNGTICKIAILNTDEGYEDSAKISHWLSDAMSSEVVVKKEVILPKNTNIYNMVKKGQAIQEGDSLLIFQNAFDEEDMNALLKNLSDDEDEITDLARIPIRSKITGKVEDINIYRTVEKEELSGSLNQKINEYEKDINALRKIMEKYNIEDAKSFDSNYKLDPTGKLKNARDSVLIEFYLKYDDKMSIGDKLVYYSALKGVVKGLFPVGKEPYSEYRKDEKIHSLLAIGSVNGRMVASIKQITGIYKVLIELDRQTKDIMGIPYKYLDEM